MRREAQLFAEQAYTQALRSMFELVERRIDWRWANATMLALRARRMAELLTKDPGRVAFRKARIQTWRRRARRHEARAWATEQALASACSLPR